MRQRQRSPILSILQLAIFAFMFWQVTQGVSSDPGGSPMAAFDSTFRTMRIIFLGIIAMIALNVLYPLAAWGIGRLRERQATWEPEERFAVSVSNEPARQDRHCPGCGASIFDDAAACPWCGHRLDTTSSRG